MRIRVLTAKPGLPAGTVIDVSDAEGKAWLMPDGTAGDGEVTKDSVTRQTAKAEKATADPTK